QERVQAEAEEDYREKAVGALVDAAESIEFPPVMVKREIDRLIQDQARNLGLEVEQYLANSRRTREQLHEELTHVATERVRRSLALTRLAEQEAIKADDQEIDAEVERLAGSSGEQGEQLRRLFASPDARAAIARSLVTRKTMDRLTEIASPDG